MAGTCLDDSLLDEIHHRLCASESGKIPVTLKYTFSMEEGELAIECSSSAKLLLPSFKMRLVDDGNQFKLFDDFPTQEPTPPQQEQKPATPEPESPPTLATTPAAERLAAIQMENESLYIQGAIPRAMAEKAGVDVDKIDKAANEFASEVLGSISDEQRDELRKKLLR